MPGSSEADPEGGQGSAWVAGVGFDSYLAKPVNVVKLIHTVRQQCPDVRREGPLPARAALALAHPGALAGLPSSRDGRP